MKIEELLDKPLAEIKALDAQKLYNAITEELRGATISEKRLDEVRELLGLGRVKVN